MSLEATLAGDNRGSLVQGFATRTILTVANNEVLSMDNVLAVRLSADTSIQINGVGDICPVYTGQIIVRGKGVQSIKFITGLALEVM